MAASAWKGFDLLRVGLYPGAALSCRAQREDQFPSAA